MSGIGYIYLAMQREYQVSMADQQKAINDYATGIKLSISDIFVEEGSSMKKPFKDRPEGKRVVAEMQGGDTIIVYNSAWLLGSAREAVKLLKLLRKKQVALHCIDLGVDISMPAERKLAVTEGPADLILQLLESLSVCESSKHGESIKAAKKQLKRRGLYLGGPVPFGWKVSSEGVLERNGTEQKIIKEILRLREDRWSYRDISIKLWERFQLKLSHEGVRKALERNRKATIAEKTKKVESTVKQVVGLAKHDVPTS